MEDKIIKTSDVAKMLGVSVNTVRLWRLKDRGPAFFQRGYGRFFYREADVIQFAKEMGFDS